MGLRIFRGLWGRIGLTLFAVGLFLSPAVWDSIKLLRLAGEGAIAEYRLRHTPPERYIEEIEIALTAVLALAGRRTQTSPTPPGLDPAVFSFSALSFPALGGEKGRGPSRSS